MLYKEIILKNGQTCILRQPQVVDAQDILDYMSNICAETDFLTFGRDEIVWTLEEEEKFIKEHLEDSNKMITVAQIDGNIVGITDFTGGKQNRIHHFGELGITVLRKYWSLGIGSALIETLLEWAKNSGVIRKINLRVRVDNKRAIKLYKKFGFIKEGTISRQLLIENVFYDTYLMGLEID